MVERKASVATEKIGWWPYGWADFKYSKWDLLSMAACALAAGLTNVYLLRVWENLTHQTGGGPIAGAFLGFYQIWHLIAGGLIRRPGCVLVTSLLSTLVQTWCGDPWRVMHWGLWQGLGAELPLLLWGGYRSLSWRRMFLAGGLGGVFGHPVSRRFYGWARDSSYAWSFFILFVSSAVQSGLFTYALFAERWKAITKWWLCTWLTAFVIAGVIVPTFYPGSIWKSWEVGSLLSYAVLTLYYYWVDCVGPDFNPKRWRPREKVGTLTSIMAVNLAVAGYTAFALVLRGKGYEWHLVAVSAMGFLYLLYDFQKGDDRMLRRVDVPFSFASLAVLSVYLYYSRVLSIEADKLEPFAVGAVIVQLSASALVVQIHEPGQDAGGA